MLSRSVCSKCRKTHWPNFSIEQTVLTEVNDRWYCPAKLIHDSIEDVIIDDTLPPPNCCYKFEHAVAEGLKNA